MTDIGKDLAHAYDDGFSDGYRSALQEVEYQVKRLSTCSLASWYSRESMQRIIREEMKKLEKLRSEKVEN